MRDQQIKDIYAINLFKEQTLKENEINTRELILNETKITQDLIKNYKIIELDVLMKQLSKLDNLKRKFMNSGSTASAKNNEIQILHTQLKTVIYTK
jgi:hypothetical protein